MSRPFAEARQDSVRASTRDIVGFYFGYSDVQAGRIGWFVQLDSRTASGKIYLPPQVLPVRNLIVTQDGKISFQFEDNNQVRFDGHIDAEITGEFSYSNGRSFETHLSRIDEKWLTDKYAGFAGLYSNVRFVAEAGDLVGEELLLFPQSDGLGGILTTYEGVPGNISALTNVQTSNGAITFEVVTNEDVQKLTGQLLADKVVIKKLGNNNPQPEPITLPKRKNLKDSLSSSQTTVPQ